MTRIDRGDIHKCLTCDNDYLEGYPHRHATEPQSSYDPMPDKPATRAELVATIRREYLAEKPPRLHVRQVPSHAEPIGVSQYSAEAAGYVTNDVPVLDIGELGSPPWSPSFHRYIGGARWWDGEMVMVDLDAQVYPWTRNLNSLRRWCGGKHATWYEHQGKPLCWTLIHHVMLGGYSIFKAAEAEQISAEKAGELLFGHRELACDHVGRCPDGAFDKWWAWASNDMNGLTLRRARAA